MDNFSCQRHTIPIRISQLTVLSNKDKYNEKIVQEIFRKLNFKFNNLFSYEISHQYVYF